MSCFRLRSYGACVTTTVGSWWIVDPTAAAAKVCLDYRQPAIGPCSRSKLLKGSGRGKKFILMSEDEGAGFRAYGHGMRGTSSSVREMYAFRFVFFPPCSGEGVKGLPTSDCFSARFMPLFKESCSQHLKESCSQPSVILQWNIWPSLFSWTEEEHASCCDAGNSHPCRVCTLQVWQPCRHHRWAASCSSIDAGRLKQFTSGTRKDLHFSHVNFSAIEDRGMPLPQRGLQDGRPGRP